MWLLAPVVFYPMLWLRPLFLFAARILGGLSLLAALGGACFNLLSETPPIEIGSRFSPAVPWPLVSSCSESSTIGSCFASTPHAKR
jgi:hypothetical protein